MTARPSMPKLPAPPPVNASITTKSGSLPAGQNTIGLVIPQTTPNTSGSPTNPSVQPETLAESFERKLGVVKSELDRLISLTPGQIWDEATGGFNAQGLASLGEISSPAIGFPATVGAHVYSAVTAAVANPFPGLEGKNASGRGGSYVVAQGTSGCLVGTYKNIKEACSKRGGQAHHIVADSLNRTSNRTDRLKGKGTVPGFPDFWNGPSICLQGNAKTPGTSHNKAHEADREIAAAGMRTNNGVVETLPVSEGVKISVKHAKLAAPHCSKQIDEEVRKAYPDHEKDSRPMNSAGRPPTTDAKDAIESSGQSIPRNTSSKPGRK